MQISIPVHNLLTDEGKLRKSHIIAYGDPVGFQFGFSRYENQIIDALPLNVKDGYRLAKSVRSILRSCHVADNKFERLKNDCAAERITTYMLKTVVLFMTSEGIETEDLSIQPREWAYKIYECLLNYLTKDKRIPHFFLNESNREDEECIFKIEMNRKHLRERERIDMIEGINKILCALRQTVRSS